MTRWEYCEVIWQPETVFLTMPAQDADAVPTTYPAPQWPRVLATLGNDGWEMVTCTPSPVGMHEYYLGLTQLAGWG